MWPKDRFSSLYFLFLFIPLTVLFTAKTLTLVFDPVTPSIKNKHDTQHVHRHLQVSLADIYLTKVWVGALRLYST